VLTIKDTHGQQAVDFLCYDADNTADRYSATNTVKVQGNVYVGNGTVLYADSGKPLLTVIEDTVGKHDTIYGCCSNPNNKLRYGVETTEVLLYELYPRASKAWHGTSPQSSQM
jgi:uncharacterized protein YcgI (DUF1989 family)